VVGIMRKSWVRTTLSSLFETVQERLGVSVTPSHFYFPVPKLRSLRNKDWGARQPCAAIDFRFADQLERLNTELLPFAPEWSFADHQNGSKSEFHFNNGFFEHVDAEVAYSFVRQRKPRRVVEVGCGNTTLLLTAAIRKNAAEGFPCEMHGIDPHPSVFLKEGVPGLTRLIEEPVQRAPVDLFRALEENDILFIDSSHVVSIDSDVVYELLNILPELKPGVLVHFHDIFAPLDYPEKFVKKNLCFWGEQYLLEAFLSFNSEFKVLWAGSAMQQHHAEVLRNAFPGWEGSFARMPSPLKMFVPSLDGVNVWPCSFWVAKNGVNH
jgi:hypothetical protein